MASRYTATLVAGLLAIVGVAGVALAQPALDVPEITAVTTGHAKATLTVQAGPSGAPNGFTIFWMKKSDFDANNGQWWSYGNAVQGEAYFWGTPVLNTWDGTLSSFVLGPNQSAKIEIGDLFDEDGVTTNRNSELDYGIEYVFCAFAVGDDYANFNSDYSANSTQPTTTSQNCTFTQGFWKTHPAAWPPLPDCGGGFLKLGTVCYTQAQLLSILNNAVVGNGLVSLAHQLIAAKLNILNGADGTVVNPTIAAADAQIGGLVVPPVGAGFLSPSSTSATTQILDDWNNGITGPGHCGDTPTRHSTWGTIKALYR
jgi:hypothetical protein